MIKSEIAKYRLLKSKGAIGSNEETKENGSSSKTLSKNSSSGFYSPSKAEVFNNTLGSSYLRILEHKLHIINLHHNRK